MGLDISYYSGLVRVDCTDGVDCDHVHVFVNEDFPGRAAPLVDGCYGAPTDDGSSGHFRAGSYGGYNAWRDELAKLAGYDSAEMAWKEIGEGPFVELINFSDCEGAIGPAIAAKLARDFATHDEAARAHFDGYGYQKYGEWRHAFEVASNGGGVMFH